MSRIKEYIDKLKAISEQVQTDALLRVVNAHKTQLIDYNQAQLLAGKNSRGEVLGTYRNEKYAALKNRLNPLAGFGVWDLRLSGDLYSAMFIDAQSFPVTIDSSDSKADKFRDVSPFNLDTKSKDEFIQEIRPEIENYYRSILQF